MRHVVLFLTLLRYRVALMLLLFYTFGIVVSSYSSTVSAWPVILGAIALLCSYVTATSINDIADRKIDEVNHPHSPGRPLVSGKASLRDMWVVNIAASVLTLVIGGIMGAFVRPMMSLPIFGHGAPPFWLQKIMWTLHIPYEIGFGPIIILLAGLAVAYLYSMPPVKLSHRTLLAYPLLGLGYVVIPYLLGIVAADGRWGFEHWIIAPVLFVFFLGRIILKDFRDRKGDSLYGRPTFLLRFGKTATCFTSLVCVAVAHVFFAIIAGSFGEHAKPVEMWLFIGLTSVFFLAIYMALIGLWRAKEEHEQFFIGLGAKMGNGALIFMLGLMILMMNKAEISVMIAFSGTMIMFFLIAFIVMVTNPKLAVNAYRG